MNWMDPTFLVAMAVIVAGLVCAGFAAWKTKSITPVIEAAEKDVPMVIAAVVADEAKAKANSTVTK
jgi:hypothetical protein